MTLNILMILLGVSTLAYSFLEARVWGCLYCDREAFCIEKYLRATRATDLVSCVHNVVKCAFGLILTLSGLKPWMPLSSVGVVHSVLVAFFALLVLDVLAVEGSSRVFGLRELRTAIERQWRSEKRVSAEHDHEVNAYRGAVRVTHRYPVQIIAMGVSLAAILILIL